MTALKKIQKNYTSNHQKEKNTLPDQQNVQINENNLNHNQQKPVLTNTHQVNKSYITAGFNELYDSQNVSMGQKLSNFDTFARIGEGGISVNVSRNEIFENSLFQNQTVGDIGKCSIKQKEKRDNPADMRQNVLTKYLKN